MPSVFAMLAGADSLETLCIPEMSLARAICFPSRVDKMQTLEKTIDVAARDVAREVYGCLFTFLRRAVAVRGIDKVTEMMDVFGDVSVVHNPDRLRAPVQPRHIVGIQWTEERITALKKALGEEIERLLKEDVNR
ncbi:hypothetical protein Daus18300_005711 [Diaporthe australafricana]|uniref:Uncharacterized protein n=1 Tax=Diaporthe australafricana TaxID=127596 RepID=A0ABR3WZS3_9PEZI